MFTSASLHSDQMEQRRERQLLFPRAKTNRKSRRSPLLYLRSVRHAVTRFFRRGLILKALFFLHGLRDPRKAGFWAVLFTIALLVTDLVYIVLRTLSVVICPNDDMSWLCATVNTDKINGTHFLIPESRMSTNRLVLLMAILAGVSSHFVFFFCVIKLDRRENAIRPSEDAFVVNNRSFWLKTNVLLVILGLALISMTAIVKANLVAAYLWVTIQHIALWRTIVNCCLFGMLMMALNDCVKRCENEIKNLHTSDVNDTIAIHQQLCARVFSTSDTLKSWFVINWLALFFVSVLYIGNIGEMLDSWYDYYANLWYICIALFMFLYPCYSAASVTSKCRQILIDMNMTTTEDWPPGHPFKQRGQLLQFIQYAEYTQCGFRVGKTVFGTNYAWLSTVLALLAGAAKFLYN